MTVTVRYAPSPTGRLHLGNARPAVLNWLFAKGQGGKYILRLDDTDLARSTEESAQGIHTDLAWLGIVPDSFARQSDRFALYDAAKAQLIAAGRLYPAYETADELDRKRKRARALGNPPIYDRAALSLTADDIAKFESEGRKPHWRFKLEGTPITFVDLIKGEQTVNTASMSDPVLIREDGTYLYTLPSVVDDIDMGITHVIRGEDHVSNTGTQIEIFKALGGTVPVFAHHNLLTDSEGQGFSKRLGSLSLQDLRGEGYEPLAVGIMASVTGTSLPVEPYPSLQSIADKLDLSMISHGSARFDTSELAGLNARIVHAMEFEDVKDRLAEFGVSDPAIWNALRFNLSKFNDIADLASIFAADFKPVVDDEDKEFIAQAKTLLPSEPWDETTWGAWTGALKEATGRKGKTLFMPLRMALTGRHDGPELKTLLPLLGRKASEDRLL